MTTYFTAPDGHGADALWVHTGVPDLPQPVLRKVDLGIGMAHHWDEIVSRVIAGNPSATRNKLVNAIDDLTRTPSPPSQGLMQIMPEWKPNVERPCTHESWQLDGNQRTCAECGQRLSDDPDRQPRRINPTFMT